MARLLKQPLKLALIQLKVGADKSVNLANARKRVLEASDAGAGLIVLPECFNSPIGPKHMPGNAETVFPAPPTQSQSPSFHALSEMARDSKAYVLGGSIPEDDSESKRCFNTSMLFGPSGNLLAHHRKVHLFDIDIPGKSTFKESDVISPGNKVTLVDIPPYGKIAIAICYDVRFPELAMIAARKGAFLLLYPAQFTMHTGKMHWHLLSRGLATQNQVYVAMCSAARNYDMDFQTYGHSLVVDPDAEVLVEAGEDEDIVYADLDDKRIEEIRQGIPLYTQRRFDVYPDVSAGKIRYED